MQTLPTNPRQMIETALAEAPEQVLRVLADVYAASRHAVAGRTVIVRFNPEGETTAETLTHAPEAKHDASVPANLLEAFQATGQPYYEALERGRESRTRLLAAEGGVISGANVAKHLGISRQAVDKRRRTGRLLGVSVGKRGYAYPVWQFAGAGMLPGIEDVFTDLRDHDPWMQMVFFLEPDLWLDDRLPLQELRLGNIGGVRRAARMLGEHSAA